MKKFLLSSVLVFAALGSTGCVQLTEKQRNQVTVANTKIVAIQARLRTLVPKGEELYRKIKDVVEKVAKGDLPKEEGERLIEFYKKQKDPVEAEILAGIEEVKTLGKVVQAINDSGVPWYQQLWLLLPGILAGGVAAFRSSSKLGMANAVLGVLSRAGNVTPGFGAKVHTEAGKSGVSVADTNAAWGLAEEHKI